jgi:hypothetical protein
VAAFRLLETAAMTHIGPSPGRTGETTQTVKGVIAALWVVVLLFAGWMWSDSRDQRKVMADELFKVRADQQSATERIAIQEESMRNVRESLKRIEDGVNALNRERRSR